MAIITDENYKSRLVCFLILFLSAGFLITNNIISSLYTIILWLVVLIICCLSKLTISLKCIFVFGIISIVMLINMIYNNSDIRLTIIYIFSYFVGTFLVFAFDFDIFKKSYQDVMYFLCVISLVGTISFIFFPALANLFVVKNANGVPFSNFVLFVHSCNVGSSAYYRNQGIFWEPGAFQTFIALACFFEINNKIVSIKRLLVYIISIITTFSTTGYLALVFLFVFAIKKANKDNKKVKNILLLSFLAFFCIMYFNQDVFFSTSDYTVFGKIINFLNEDLESGKVTSSSIRFYALTKPIELFFWEISNMLIGVGTENLRTILFSYTKGMNTCTVINWFAIYGIFYGSIMTTGIVLFFKKFNKNFLFSLLYFVFFFVIVMSENYVNSVIIYILCLYGFHEDCLIGEKNEHLTNKQL